MFHDMATLFPCIPGRFLGPFHQMMFRIHFPGHRLGGIVSLDRHGSRTTCQIAPHALVLTGHVGRAQTRRNCYHGSAKGKSNHTGKNPCTHHDTTRWGAGLGGVQLQWLKGSMRSTRRWNHWRWMIDIHPVGRQRIQGLCDGIRNDISQRHAILRGGFQWRKRCRRHDRNFRRQNRRLHRRHNRNRRMQSLHNRWFCRRDHHRPLAEYDGHLHRLVAGKWSRDDG
mmetsp:Transcript_17179/g.39800  ORF Transcript_17179/g.39800 Transcript_17179/m.39800 type:complete len:225 (-) Transcript_17179:602-1276(-)